MKNLGNQMKQAQQMQEKMAEMQARLADIEVSGSAGGGMIQVTLNGKGEFRRVRIDPALVRPEEIAVLEDLIVAASNDARMKVETMAQDEMRKLTGGLPIPPGMKLPF